MSGYDLLSFGPASASPDWLSRQTLTRSPEPAAAAIQLGGWGLPDPWPADVPMAVSWLEQMAWALAVRPAARCLVCPLHVSFRGGAPAACEVHPARRLAPAIEGGAMILWRGGGGPVRPGSPREAFRAHVAANAPVAVCTRALLDERQALRLPVPMAQRLSRAVDAWLRALRERCSTASSFRREQVFEAFFSVPFLLRQTLSQRLRQDPMMAWRRHWEPSFPAPAIEVRASPADGRIRVLMAMHWLEVGGAEKGAVELIQNLPRDRYAITVTTDVPSDNPWAARIAAQVEEIIHLPSFLDRSEAAPFLDHLIRSRRIDLLHIHHSAWAYESLPYLRRFHPRLAVLDTLHIIELPPSPGGYPEFSCSAFEPFIDRHHVISDHLKRFLRERWRVPDGRIRRVYLNVDTAAFRPEAVEAGAFRAAWRLPAEARLVGFAGRFVRQKRPERFIAMAALLMERWRRERPAWALRFVMAGGGPLLAAARRQARRMGLDGSMTFTDVLNDVRPLYRDVDALVLPSENEGLALAAFEAMAMGAVVVSTNVGAQDELIDAQLLVPPDGEVAARLADVVWPLLGDDDRRHALGKQGQARVRESHTAQVTVAAMRELYDELLRERGAIPQN